MEQRTPPTVRGRLARAIAIGGIAALALTSAATLGGGSSAATRDASAAATSAATQKKPKPTRTTPTPRPSRTTPSPSASPTATPSPSSSPSAQQATTTVSLTFDDGRASQSGAAEVLAARGLDATYFVNSGYIGASGYLTRAQLQALAAQGNEIGGHTVTHADLTTAPAAEAKLQVCQDRATLTEWGFEVRSFAYPFAAVNDAARQAVADCGYNSARGLGDLRSPSSCENCDAGEDLPPNDPYLTRAPDQVESTWTLADFQSLVQAAQSSGGGWIQFTFHDFDTGEDLSVSRATFTALADWLAAQQQQGRLAVRTVGDAVGGDAKPVVQVGDTQKPPLKPGQNGIVNGGFEDLADTGQPVCWWQSTWGANTSAFSLVQGISGSRAARVQVSGYESGDGKWLPNFDLGSCAPTVQAGHTYSLRSTYTSTEVTQFAVYLRSASGVWSYWTSSPWFAASASAAQAEWETPAVPDGYTGISFGLNMFRDGTLVVDDVELYDAVGAPAAGGAG